MTLLQQPLATGGAAVSAVAGRPTTTMNMVQAINEALGLALEHDPQTLLFGEDVGRMGGVFRASDNLQMRFGTARVFDTPLAEAGIVGLGIGMALAGMRPIAEVQFAGFLYPALDQILSHLGRYRHRSRGRFSLPMVIRAPFGGGVHTPEQHADSPEGILASVPGVKVVIPSTPGDAKGLLLAAIADPDPVFFLEGIKLYRSLKEPVANGHYTIPLGQARIARAGDDCTIICYGGMVEVSLAAAEAAAVAGISVEVIDLRSLVPLDLETIIASVSKTGRAAVVYEAPRTMGFGAEVVAQIAERCLDVLQAPLLRVTGYDAPYPPFTSVEQHYRPNPARVAAAIRQLIEY
jgi:pyruvate dehydrogenase E1 component beta subunit